MTKLALHPLLDSLSTAVVQLDGALCVDYVNTAAEQLLGIYASNSLGKSLIHLVKLPDSLIERLSAAQKTGQGFSDRQVSVGPFGRESLLVDCVITPLGNDSASSSIIIELMAVDRRVRIARDAEIKNQQEFVQSMLRGMAHEIKNPLGGIRGAAQLLARAPDGEDPSEYTDVIVKEADRLQALIDRMLSPATRPDNEEINIHEVLEHVRKIVKAAASDNVSISADYDPSIPELVADRNRLTQVFLNILGNALNAVGERGNIVVTTRIVTSFTIGGKRHPLVAKTDIEDDGPGIPDSMIDSIFYPMVSGKEKGTGLGLSIAQSIMAQIGGIIECSSQPGQTIFSIYLPLEQQ